MTFDEFEEQFTEFSETPMAVCGQKEVYTAVHPQYGTVVVKRLRHTDERAIREVEIAKNHAFEGTPQLFEALMLEEHGTPCLVIVEQYIKGFSLDKIIAQGTRYGLSEIVDFLEQAFRFVGRIAEAGIVHRDIKPGNIIKDDSGAYVFLDFGIARVLGATSLTQTGGNGPNTPGYAAPEQFQNKKDEIDSRADLFSVGVVAYELLTGINPFRDQFASDIQIYLNTMTITPTQLTIPGDDQLQLAGLISSLMSKRILGRPESATEALKWLDRAKTTFNQKG